MRKLLLLLSLVLAGCATGPHLPVAQTASERFSTLGCQERRVASEFYDLGAGDAIKQLYWGQRDAQERRSGYSEAEPSLAPLEHRFVNVPVPEHVEPDGTIKEASNQVIEVVRWMERTR